MKINTLGYVGFESPDATLAIVCHHHQVYVDRE